MIIARVEIKEVNRKIAGQSSNRNHRDNNTRKSILCKGQS